MEYIVGRCIEASFIDNSEFGLKILVDAGRTLTDRDRTALYKAADDLQRPLLSETVRLDPKRQKQREANRREIVSLFAEPIFVEEIPNAYCNDWCCSDIPWFIVTTRIGRIKIGWRKRVIEIDWSGSAFLISAEALFSGEQVTKDGRLIHAWGLDKAREYIRRLLAAAQPYVADLSPEFDPTPKNSGSSSVEGSGNGGAL